MKTITEAQVREVLLALHDNKKLLDQLMGQDHKVQYELRETNAAIKIMEGL